MKQEGPVVSRAISRLRAGEEVDDRRSSPRVPRAEMPQRDVRERVLDWRETRAALPPPERDALVSVQAGRCLDCGIPFCQSAGFGCPLGNRIPEWNALASRGLWAAASARLHETDNFPEFTGRLCPAPCESACVLAQHDHTAGVTIESVERTIADHAFEDGAVHPLTAEHRSGRTVAVIGSGPAGLAAAQQLTRAGHTVIVYERDDRPGGLLRYGIPPFKMDKALIDRRLEQMRCEGTVFRTGCDVGVDVTVSELRSDVDAIVLAVGARRGRDIEVPGRGLAGIRPALPYLIESCRARQDGRRARADARGRRVVVIGGGDTGADCVGTAHRQGARSVVHLDYRPRPPDHRTGADPWPTRPLVLRTCPAHEEGGDRRFEVAVQRFVGDRAGHVRAVVLTRVDRARTPTGAAVTVPCDLALLALGFDGVGDAPVLDDLGVARTRRGTLACDDSWRAAVPGVFVCGDAHRGASLVVWAIAEGRAAARAVDDLLSGSSDLPAPVTPRSGPCGS